MTGSPIPSNQEHLLFTTGLLEEGDKGKPVKFKKTESHVDSFLGLLPLKWPYIPLSGASHLTVYTRNTSLVHRKAFSHQASNTLSFCAARFYRESCRIICVTDCFLFIQVLNHEEESRSNRWLLTLSGTLLMLIHWKMPAIVIGPILKPVDNLEFMAYGWKLFSLPISWRWSCSKSSKSNYFLKKGIKL